ncbi:hypothetical protein GCM10010464_04260 [Pseudonocardia yunnanensis]|uniref:Uncharacterized protein n=1 Tax=Pseudonocardia yunnanensis TaxID=58107 RepID=A0ABW4EX81_9PSEU
MEAEQLLIGYICIDFHPIYEFADFLESFQYCLRGWLSLGATLNTFGTLSERALGLLFSSVELDWHNDGRDKRYDGDYNSSDSPIHRSIIPYPVPLVELWHCRAVNC